MTAFAALAGKKVTVICRTEAESIAMEAEAIAYMESVTGWTTAGMLSTMTNPADALFNQFARCADVTDKLDTLLFTVAQLADADLVESVTAFLDVRQGVDRAPATQTLSHDVAGFKGPETVKEEATGIQPGDQVVDVHDQDVEPVTNPGSPDGLA